MKQGAAHAATVMQGQPEKSVSLATGSWCHQPGNGNCNRLYGFGSGGRNIYNDGMSLLGKDSFQEIDITGVTMPITKYNFIVKDISKLAQNTASCVYHLQKRQNLVRFWWISQKT